MGEQGIQMYIFLFIEQFIESNTVRVKETNVIKSQKVERIKWFDYEVTERIGANIMTLNLLF